VKPRLPLVRTRLALAAAAILLPLAPPAFAQLPSVEPLAAAPVQQGALRVEVDHDGLLADGRGRVRFRVTRSSAAGTTAPDGSALRISVSGGLLLGADGQPLAERELRLTLKDGAAAFTLLAPTTPGTVQVVVEGGNQRVEGALDFAPALRELIATGVVEGVIGQGRLHAGSIQPTGFGDSFEQDIEHWRREFSAGRYAAARTAFFVKGQIGGQALLTAAYDSDKATRQRLAAVVDPNAVYPVYGDNAIVGFDAVSASRLYVRIDRDKTWLLYGDFSTTGVSTAPPLPGGPPDPAGAQPDKVRLGRYTRSATGLRAHAEAEGRVADLFVFDDSLKQALEEYPANGTSGPFAVRNGNAVQYSERVEVIVRDKNQRDRVRSVTPLLRYVDYSFEPFSGRILLNTPLPTLTPAGDPVSLRVGYEVDQGGARFLVAGASTDVQLAPGLRLGGAMVEDSNPLSPFRLHSLRVDVAPAPGLHVVAEAARTNSTLYEAQGRLYANPSGLGGETGLTTIGHAGRIELGYEHASLSGRLWWLHTDAGFNNPDAGVAAGRSDSGLRSAWRLDEATRLVGEYTATQDELAQAGRHAARLGLQRRLGVQWTAEVSLVRLHDEAGFAAESLLAPNAVAGGGFFGTGTSATVTDPLTGMPVNTLAPVGATRVNGASGVLDATTLRLDLQWAAAENLEVRGVTESSVDGDHRQRAELSLRRTISEVDSVFARIETQTGLASAQSLLPAERSTVLAAGIVHTLSPETRAFSEYRRTEASSQALPSVFDQLVAVGLRNTHPVREGLLVETSAEHLRVLSGPQREAYALAGGINYSASATWKLLSRLEYRQLGDDATLPGNQAQAQWLSTLTAARQLTRDWTLLLKHYGLLQHNHEDATGLPQGDTRQQRSIGGFAWRPRDDNRYNALASLEFKKVDDRSQALGERYTAGIASLNLDYHPDRPTWASGHLAAKRRRDSVAPGQDASFTAGYVSGRLTREIGPSFDIGVLAARLWQAPAGPRLSAAGLEGGCVVARNAWVSVGYNWTGFSDRDLAASDYTQRGFYLRLRVKFDEDSLHR
jgi:hypothetical protein